MITLSSFAVAMPTLLAGVLTLPGRTALQRSRATPA
jgi:hypothetical protein